MPHLRRLLLPLLLLLAALALGACGSSDDDDAGSSGAAATTGASASAFPVSVAHKYGTAEIDAAPKRVVVVGLREQDDLLALGIAPVATTEWFGEEPGAIAPWARAELGSRPLPTVLTNTDGIDIEQVASLRPDLIVGIYSGMTRDEHTTLSKIAPTIAQPKGVVDYGSTWEQELTMIGTAVGKADEARQMGEQVRSRVEQAAAAHPEFEGRTATVAAVFEGTYIYGPQDARTRFLTDLGFVFPKRLSSVGGKDEFGGSISNERLDLLDLDTVVWLTEGRSVIRSVKEDPVYRDLGVREEGRDLFVDEADGDIYAAFSKESVLSLPIMLDDLVPRLAAAVDDDPATSTDPQ